MTDPNGTENGPDLAQMGLEDSIFSLFFRAANAEWSAAVREQIIDALRAGHRFTASCQRGPGGGLWLRTEIGDERLFDVDAGRFMDPWSVLAKIPDTVPGEWTDGPDPSG